MKLRPGKGEGERRYSKIQKPLLLATTVLIFAYPICIAEQARAATSSALGLPLQFQSQTAIGTQKQSLPRTSPIRSLPQGIPSTSEIDTLKSTLANYQTQLIRLKAQNPLNPANKAALADTIANVEDKISTLQAKISALTSAKADYERATTLAEQASVALSQAQASQQQALATLTSATSNADVAKTAYEEATAKVTDAQNKLDTATSNEDAARSALTSASALVTRQTTTTTTALALLNSAISTAGLAATNLQQAQSALNVAISDFNSIQASAEQASSEVTTATNALTSANDDAARKRSALLGLQTSYNNTVELKNVATSNLTQAQQNYNQTVSDSETAWSQFWTANSNLGTKTSALQTAQNNYNNNLIPDPTWVAPTQQVAHTRQVPHTTTTIQQQTIPNLLNNSDFSQETSAWSGVTTGWQNSSPGMFNGQIVFSYTTQTVSQGLYSGPFQNATLTLSADWYNEDSNRNQTDVYSMKVEAWDIDHNSVGTATYNSTGRHQWENKSVSLTATGPVSYITVSFTGVDSGYWLGNYGPHLKNPNLQVTYGQEITETTYTTETYYTTEVIQPQQGLTVKVYNGLNSSNPQRSDTAYNLCKTTTLTKIENNWGGGDILGCGGDRVLIHYTGYITPTENITYLMNQADDGFYMSINGTNVINNWTLKGCGGNWNSVSLQAGQSYAIDAWFFEWGGGACSTLYYQSATSSGVVPAAWYSNGASAPMIKDPALLIALQTAQAEYDIALETRDYVWAQVGTLEQLKNSRSNEVLTLNGQIDSYTSQISNLDTQISQATSDVADAESVVTSAEADLTQIQTSNEEVLEQLAAAESSLALTRVSFAAATNDNDVAQSDLATATSTYDLATSDLTAAKQEQSSAEVVLTIATQEKVAAQSVLDTHVADQASKQDVLTTTNQVLTAATTSHEEATNEVISQQASVATASEKLDVATAKVATSYEEAVAAPKPDKEITQAEAILEEPAPPVEEGSKEIPAELSAENLMDVDLNKVDPTELTPAQADQLVAAALETFQTATEGSPEYQQALDALYLAAEQDDIELSPELAAIPGLAAATELINFFGNAGADMSPKKREESKKVVVTAVVAAGAAIQAAAGAATSAASSASSSSSGSGSTRRKIN